MTHTTSTTEQTQNPTKTSFSNNVTGINTFGEIPLVGAPKATLANGTKTTPQQFFVYQRNKDIVENIIRFIEFDVNYPLFVTEDAGQVFLQVGILGQENYPPNQQARPRKIVYGRKWFIEPTQPTSEIIQTAYLALVKAREHELREFLTIRYDHHGEYKKATPFNSHIDLPLMAKNPNLFAPHTDNWTDRHSNITNLLSRIYLANHQFELHDYLQVDAKQCLITLSISSDSTSPLAHFFPELTDTQLTLLTKTNDNAFLYTLMDALLAKSQQYIEENFKFQGFARFSRQQNIQAIGQFSLDTRLLPENPDSRKQADFQRLFRDMTIEVDSARAPTMAKHPILNTQQKTSLENEIIHEGYLPKQLTP